MALFGTKSVLFAPVESDGSVPEDTAFEVLCKTYRDTVEIVDADPETSDEYNDQEDDPFVTFFTAGKTEGKFSGYEYDTTTLTNLLGGTVLDGEWTEGEKKPKEMAIRFFTDSGHRITYPKVTFFAKKNMKLKKKESALIDCQFTANSKARIKKMP